MFTGDDEIALAQQLPFIIGTGTAVIQDRAIADPIVQAYVCARVILRIMKLDQVFPADLSELRQEVVAIGPLIKRILLAVESVCVKDDENQQEGEDSGNIQFRKGRHANTPKVGASYRVCHPALSNPP